MLSSHFVSLRKQVAQIERDNDERSSIPITVRSVQWLPRESHADLQSTRGYYPNFRVNRQGHAIANSPESPRRGGNPTFQAIYNARSISRQCRRNVKLGVAWTDREYRKRAQEEITDRMVHFLCQFVEGVCYATGILPARIREVSVRDGEERSHSIRRTEEGGPQDRCLGMEISQSSFRYFMIVCLTRHVLLASQQIVHSENATVSWCTLECQQITRTPAICTLNSCITQQPHYKIILVIGNRQIMRSAFDAREKIWNLAPRELARFIDVSSVVVMIEMRSLEWSCRRPIDAVIATRRTFIFLWVDPLCDGNRGHRSRNRGRYRWATEREFSDVKTHKLT